MNNTQAAQQGRAIAVQSVDLKTSVCSGYDLMTGEPVEFQDNAVGARHLARLVALNSQTEVVVHASRVKSR